MGTTLFVGGLAGEVDEEALRRAFEDFGELEDARVLLDRITGKGRGFGFVSFTEEPPATTALREMDGKDLLGSTLRVKAAHDQDKKPVKRSRPHESKMPMPEVVMRRGGLNPPKKDGFRRVWERGQPRKRDDPEEGG